MKATKKLFWGLLLACVLAALALYGCMGIGYEGSRWGSENGLAMEYTRFNGTDSQRLVLAAGDVLDGKIVSRGGSLKIVIQRQGDDEPVFELENAPTNSFSVGIEADGTYEIVLTASRARGSVDIQRRAT